MVYNPTEKGQAGYARDTHKYFVFGECWYPCFHDFHWVDTSADGLLILGDGGNIPPSSQCFSTDMIY